MNLPIPPKIVQTFWTGVSNQSDLHLTGGWLSAEYHWMAWALSVLQLRRFYDRVELVTDNRGKNILIDQLQLPYTSVRTDLETSLQSYPQDLWALAKIYTYGIQQEPFLHVDGDIFIWKPFELAIEQAPLVAQNLEIEFPFYREPLATLKKKFKNVPSCMMTELAMMQQIRSSNAGVLGGNNIDFFTEYKRLAFGIVEDNRTRLTKVPYNLLNICIEQFLYHCLSKEKQIPITYVIDDQGQFDPTYPDFASFHNVPFATWFIHCMANYKRQELVVWHMANRLRQDYPTYYYRILRLCQQADVTLHNPVYQYDELSPRQHPDGYFEQVGNGWNSPTNLATQDSDRAVYFYGKNRDRYQAVELLFSLPLSEKLQQSIRVDKDITLIEETEPELKQTVHYHNPATHQSDQLVLDILGMLLYHLFQEPKPIGQVIEEASLCFPANDMQAKFQQFQTLVLDRIKEGLYLGTLQWVTVAN
jgi:hypothetical protein